MEEVLNSELVFVGDNNEALTDTYKVAEVFGKEHNKVCRDINNLGCSSDFQNANFGVSFIIRDLPNGGHKKEKYYTMTKDGFTFLVMGYTGAKAARFKEAYISAFNRMEKKLREQVTKPQQDDIDVSKYGRKELAQLLIESDEELGDALEQLERKKEEVAVLKYRLEQMEKCREESLHVSIPSAFPEGKEQSSLLKRVERLEKIVSAFAGDVEGLKEWKKEDVSDMYYKPEFYKKYPECIYISSPVLTPSVMYRAMDMEDLRIRLWKELSIEISPFSLLQFLYEHKFLQAKEQERMKPTEFSRMHGYAYAMEPDKDEESGILTYRPLFTEAGFLRIMEIIKMEGVQP